MAATEHTILTTFLLAPSSLTTVFTFQSFQLLFPQSQQSSPEIKRLYRALQHRRALVTDAVAQNVDSELERGISQRRAVVKARQAAERQELDEEIAVENALYGSISNLPSSRPHTLSSILLSLELACEELSTEIRSLESEAAILLAETTATVSGLSDLRYGRFASGQLNQEVLDSLEGLDSACDTR